MAGCKFSPENEIMRFKILESQQLALLQTAGVEDPAQQAKKNALKIFNTVTFPTNVKSLVRDEIPRKDQVTAAWEIRDGQAFAEGFGTVSEIWENTKKFNPEQFNEREKNAALLGFELLIKGQVKVVAYPMYDKNGIRYISVLRRIGNTIVNESVDVGKMNRDLTAVEAADVLRLLSEKHKAASIVHEDPEFPLLKLEAAPTVAEWQKLALGRTLLTAHSQLHPYDSKQVSANDKRTTRTPKATNNSSEKIIIQTDQYLPEKPQQRQKQAEKKQRKNRLGEPLLIIIKQKAAQVASHEKTVRVKIEKLISYIKQQTKKRRETWVQKPVEIFQKLLVTKKKQVIDTILSPKHQPIKVSVFIEKKKKIVNFVPRAAHSIFADRKTTKPSVFERSFLLVKSFFSRDIVKRRLDDKPAMVTHLHKQSRETLVKPIENFRRETNQFLVFIKTRISFNNEQAVVKNGDYRFKFIKKPLIQIIKESLPQKVFVSIRKTMKENQPIISSVKLEKIGFVFIKVQRSLQMRFLQLIFPIEKGRRLNKKLVLGKSCLFRHHEFAQKVEARRIPASLKRLLHLRLAMTKYSINHVKYAWNYLALFNSFKSRVLIVSTKEKKTLRSKPQNQENGWLSFLRWLIKAVSRRRENKIPGPNFKIKLSRKKKLPKTGVIYSYQFS